MNWDTFVKHLQDAGYKGESTLGAVQTYLKESNNDADTIEVKGEVIDLKDLYESREKQRMDLSATQMENEIEELKRDREVMKNEMELLGKESTDDSPTKAVDVKVGADRLSLDKKGGFNSAGDFYADVAKAAGENQSSNRLIEWSKALSTYGNETVGADGGFAVPEEFRADINSHVSGEDSILAMTDSYPLSGNSITFPDDETTPWQTSGGIQANWEGEGDSLGQSKPALKQKNLRLRKLTALVPVTEELLADSSALETYVTRKAGEKIDFKVGEAIFRGTGAGQPLGFLNSGSLVSVAKESGQAADTVQAENINSMFSRLYAPWRRDAVWFINQDIEGQLFGMTVGNYPIYLPQNSLSGSPFATLLGRPVIATQHCETLGDQGDIVFANLGQYATAVKATGVESSTSTHVWFDQDAVAFKFRMRMDGQPWMSSTVTPRDGSNSLSAFVTLDARA